MMFRMLSMLAAAAIMGVMAATFFTCGVGLVNGTATWCALPLAWLVGFPFAILAAIVFGVPLTFIFWKLGLQRWWQFALTGVVAALPLWYDLAAPFHSPRWQSSGVYDSLNYLGSGFGAGLAYWWIGQKFGVQAPSRVRRERI
jgi:hypothetical protein